MSRFPGTNTFFNRLFPLFCMDFDVGAFCSSGLMDALKKREVDGGVFRLPIREGRLLGYLISQPVDFKRVFHIGCSADARHPYFEFFSDGVINGYPAVLRYSRSLTSAAELYPRDAFGGRDLERLAVMFSESSSYSESLVLSVRCDGLCRNYHIDLGFNGDKLSYADFSSIHDDNFRMVLGDRINGTLYHPSFLKNQKLFGSKRLVSDLLKIFGGN